MPYEVQTPVYEGPFDLLLHLILSEEVDLYEVSLARIVDAYVAEMARLEALDLEAATEFLLIAATLVELKTRRLLPSEEDVEVDEELSVWSERDTLLARLLECKTFKDAAQALSRIAADADRSYPRCAGPEERFADLVPDLLAGVGPADLAAACARALQPRPSPRIDLDHVAPIRASVTDAVQELVVELPRLGRASFRTLTAGASGRMDVVVRFLAVLELCKRGQVDLDQAETFGDIVVVWLGDEEDVAGPVLDLTKVEAYEG